MSKVKGVVKKYFTASFLFVEEKKVEESTYIVTVYFDDNTRTIKRRFLTKSGMFQYYEAISKCYRFRAVSMGDNYIVCNCRNGDLNYVWDK